MNGPTVALCMIVRNEERHLEECLGSVEDLCAERIVVDTGSDDGTVALAERAGARVVSFPWCDDFAAARNAGIAEATSDWVLVLDADERLTAGSVARIRRSLATADGVCGMLRLHDASAREARPEDVLSGRSRIGEPMHVQRLLRRTPDLRFEGIVHETIREWLVRHGNRAFYLDADIVHYGAVPAVRAERAKSDRNLRLLEKRRAAEPEDFTIHGYLAHEYASLGDHAKAHALVEEGWALVRRSSPATLRSAIRLMVARALPQLQRGDVEGVLETVNDAIAYEGESPDALFFRGYALERRALLVGRHHEDDLAQAEASYRACLDWETRPFAQRFVRGTSGPTGQMRLATVRLLRGAYEDALALFEASVAREPTAEEAALGACEALIELGRASEARQRLEALQRCSERPDAWVLAALAADELGDFNALKGNLAEARRLAPAGYLAPHRNLLHGSLHHAVLAYLGRPQAGQGAVGLACARMAGAEATGTLAGPERRLLVRLVRGLLRANQVHLVEKLLTPASESALPGVVELVKEAATSLGMAVEEQG